MRIELAFHPMQWAKQAADSVDVMFDPDANTKPTSDNRNRTCSAFLRDAAKKPDVLLMIDDDVTPQRNPLTLVPMMCAEDSPYDVIGLPTPAWQPQIDPVNPLRWMVFDVNEDEETLVQDAAKLNAPGMVQWDLVGSGAIMIHRRVLESHWMRAPFADKFNRDGHRVRGHDFNFSHRCRAAEFGVWASMDHRCGHSPRVELLDIARMMALQERKAEPVYHAAVMPDWAAS